eukprot:6487412-Amphidinium_carterae.1
MNPITGRWKDAKIGEKVDLTWQGGWPASMVKYCTLIEEIVFLDDHDTTLQTACRSGKTARDVFQYPSLQSRMSELTAERMKEREKDDTTMRASEAWPTSKLALSVILLVLSFRIGHQV